MGRRLDCGERGERKDLRHGVGYDMIAITALTNWHDELQVEMWGTEELDYGGKKEKRISWGKLWYDDDYYI